MEPRAGAAETLTTHDADPGRTRLRLLAGCAVLTGLAFVQSSGYLVADTKFDLVADPTAFLARALHLWDGSGAFGQLQNQSYGYLWPMGPFFLALGSIGIPGWVVQRLWMALVMCVAFVGTAKAARALGVRSDLAAMLAGVAFATSPRMLSTIGPISIEAWPSAVAPWVLLALVRGSQGGSPRRWGLLAGLAVAMVGGVNAAATMAVLPVGVVWLLTRSHGPRRTRLMLWWPVATVLATAWWLVPLLLLGRYSPPFLDFIESASVTTFPTTLTDALRGTSAWVPYIDPGWQGGHEVVTTGYLALNSALVLMLGIAGLLVRANPHRLFLALSVLVGLVMVTAGHLGDVQGWWAGSLHTALDGALAPLRNVHKFDPVIRLPLVLGLAWAIEAAIRAPAEERFTLGRVTIAPVHTFGTLAVLGVVGAALPLVAGHTAPQPGVIDVPDYWEEAVDWLDSTQGDSTAYLAPGSSFGDYLWGSPRDEPVQFLGAERWALRNAVPLAPPGNIRMLDSIEAQLASGQGSAGLAPALQRAGVRYLVVRNDLRPTADVPDPVLVHQALTESPGVRLRTTFGPVVGGDTHLIEGTDRLVVNGGWNEARPAIEIFQVDAGTPPSSGVVATETPVVVGGPEDLIDLSALGLVGDAPTRLAVDGSPDSLTGPVILTDGLHDRERFFGRVHDGSSAVRTASDPYRTGNPTHDYSLAPGDRWLTTSRLVGAASVTASSSASDADATGGSRPDQLPFAALDGSLESAWVAGDDASVASWRLDLGRDRSVDQVRITLGRQGADRARLRVETSAGTSVTADLDAGETRTMSWPAESVRWIRISDAGTLGRLALADVAMPGVHVTRPLVTPAPDPAQGQPDAVVLRSLGGGRSGCAVVDRGTPCRESQVRGDEEPLGFDRIVTLTSDATFDAELRARPVAGPALMDQIQAQQPLAATGSSVAVPDPRASGLAAVDGDPGTAWTPRLDDPSPTLSLNWIGARTLRGITVLVGDDAPVRRPGSVVLTWPGGTREVSLDEAGTATFPPIRTSRLTIRPTDAANAVSVTSDGAPELLPIGIAEVRLAGLDLAPAVVSTTSRDWGCGSGPTLDVDGRVVTSAVVASPADLYALAETPVRLCDATPIELAAGENRVRVVAPQAPTSRATSLVLRRTDGAFATGADDVGGQVDAVGVDLSDPVTRTIPAAVGSAGDVVALRQNANPGWVATQDGVSLQPVVLDGWQQGWVLDDDGDTAVRFAPDGTYRTAVLAGLLLLVVLLLTLLVPARRWPGANLPATRAASAPTPLLAVVALGAAGTLAGWPGVAAGAVGAVLGAALQRLRESGWLWLVAVLPGAATAAYALRPWQSPSGWAGDWAWPHYLVVVTLAAVLVAAGRRPRSRNRIEGRSTTR